MQKFAIVAAMATGLAQAGHYFDSLDRVHLRFNRDNHFKIMQLTDLHLGENTNKLHNDTLTLQLIESLIGKEQPDFVAITGDIVSGMSWDRKDAHSGFWQENYNLLAELLTGKQIPWGIVPGYHDFEGDINVFEMMQL